jgi:hypothetical protein
MTMDCRRAEGLFSDHLERSLTPILAAELERHLASCPACQVLHAAFGEVVAALRAFPALEPSARLAGLAATAALNAGRRSRPLRIPVWLQSAAAGLALVAAGTALMFTGVEGPTRAATRLVDRTSSAGVFLLERKDRLVEDLRVLRVVIGTALEGRIDRVNDRVEDYRRLLEERRPAATPPAPVERPSPAPATEPNAKEVSPGPRTDAAAARALYLFEPVGTLPRYPV